MTILQVLESQAFTNILSAAALYFLIRYVQYTRRIAEQATRQTEGMHAPAVVCERKPRTKDTNQFQLRNVGNGPALNVEWYLPGMNRETHAPLGILAPGAEVDDPHVFNVNDADLTKAAGLSAPISASPALATLVCRFESLAGVIYESENVYNSVSRIMTTRARKVELRD